MSESLNGLSQHTISALILAAGKGTRMKSTLPKVLHPVLGKTMVEWVIDVAKKAGATDVTLVLSPEIGPFKALLERLPGARIAVQKTQRGTGDAVASAARAFHLAKAPSWASGELAVGAPSKAEWILICAGDTPAMNAQTIRDFIHQTIDSKRRLGVLGMLVPEPKGYGRLVRASDGGLAKIVEERDADEQTKKITLCNSGVIFAKTEWLFELLEGVTPNNSQNEYYLTDIFAAALSKGESAFVFETAAAPEFAGVNDRVQLDVIERGLLKSRIEGLMSHGVTVHLSDTVFIEADVVIEPDTVIYPGACLKGKTRVSRNCVIGPQVVLEDASIGAGAVIGAHSVLIRTHVSPGESVAPLTAYADREL